MSEVAKTSSAFTVEERDRLLKQFHVSGLKYDEFAREHNINPQTFKNWIWIANRPAGVPRRYSPVERKKIVESFLSSNISMVDFAKTWGLSSSTLATWVQRYNEFGSDGLMNRPPNFNDKRVGFKTPDSIRAEIIQVKKKEPGFGLHKIKHWLYRFRGVKVSTGTVRKTIVTEGLPLVKIKKKKKKSSERIRRFERARPMQLWQSDITQLTVGQHSMRVYLTVFMDDHSRFIVGWRLQSRQTADLVLDAFKDGMVKYGKPEEVLTDQGRQYFAWRGKSELEKLLEKENIKHVVSRAHHPQTLGKCERFWETITNEFWSRIRPFDLDEARERLKYFIDHYNYQRPHQGINGQVPADRFFGVAEEVRSALEKSVAANSIRIATGELPKPPAFLIGQVGDQRIAFHGSTGSFYLSQDGVLNGQTISPQDSTHEARESASSNTNKNTLGELITRGSFTSAEKIVDNNGVLAGSNYEDRSCYEIRNSANQVMANEYPGHIGNECWVADDPEKKEN